MGAIADGIMAYAQPLIDSANDGSMEHLNKALALSQCCWNLALMPEDKQEQVIREMQSRLEMDDAEFDSFRSSIITPMIERHKVMFPLLHNRGSTQSLPGLHSDWEDAPITKPSQKSVGIDPYAPCRCNSGKKFKFCCRNKRR